MLDLVFENVMGCNPKSHSFNIRQNARDTLNQCKLKDSQEPWPYGVRVNMP